jgi:hypothetical protein
VQALPVEGVLNGVLGITLERLNLSLGEGHPGLDLPIDRPPGQISNAWARDEDEDERTVAS